MHISYTKNTVAMELQITNPSNQNAITLLDEVQSLCITRESSGLKMACDLSFILTRLKVNMGLVGAMLSLDQF